MTPSTINGLRAKLRQEAAEKCLFGADDALDLLFAAWLARGHVLIEGPPGTGKTLAAKILSKLLSRSFKRIQFTSDLLPADVVGSHAYRPDKREFEFVPGPIFSDCVLADEINRAPPRTQSALLEAMEERQATVEGKRFELAPDFFVVATQNPQDFEGTFPLPEAQTDRFLFKIAVGHASPEVDARILRASLDGSLLDAVDRLAPIVDVDRAALDRELLAVRVDEAVLRYVARILELTRAHPMISLGASVRGGLALAKGARACAAIAGRDYVSPDDVKSLIAATLSHRIRLEPDAQIAGQTEAGILEEIAQKAEFPA